MNLEYLSGFGNEFASEALPGALPVGQNSPQKAPYGLYTELFSGTAFTMARSEARRTWLYRIQPSANHPAFVKLARQLAGGPLGAVTPNRLRWNPLDIPSEPTDFIDGLVGMVANSGAEKPAGISIYNYRANRSMERVFFNADGELLIVPSRAACASPPNWACWMSSRWKLSCCPVASSSVSSCWMRKHAVTSPRTTALRCACLTWGRLAATAWPTPATSYAGCPLRRPQATDHAGTEIPR